MDTFMLKNRKMIEAAGGVALIGLLIFACLLVLKPFITAMLWAAILVFTSWPAFDFVKRRVTRGNAMMAATVMTLLATLMLVIPLWLLGRSSVDLVTGSIDYLKDLRETGLPQLTAAMQDHPFFGKYAGSVHTALVELFSDTERLTRWGANASKVAASWLVQRGASLGYGIFQVCFGLIFMFFFYLNGRTIADKLTQFMEQMAGPVMVRLRKRTALTLNIVVRGTLGTAFVQAVVAAIGFAIFDIPNITLLSAIVFILGILPMGPPVLWVPLGLWLLATGRTGDGIGMLLYGGIVISGVDNIVRPILIAGTWDLGMLRRFRQSLVIGAVIGLLVAGGFVFVGLPWWIGVGVALAIGFTPFNTAGVVCFLGGSIGLFAMNQLINGLWLFLFAMGLLVVMPIVTATVRRWVPEVKVAAGPKPLPEEGIPFALMLIGVTGGMIAFGFIGLFLGPVLLAVAYDLIREISREGVSLSPGEQVEGLDV
jgi:predicted PurR-regulated permease PerM